MVKEVCFGMAFNSLQLNILCVPPNSVHIYLFKQTDFLFLLHQRLPALSLQCKNPNSNSTQFFEAIQNPTLHQLLSFIPLWTGKLNWNWGWDYVWHTYFERSIKKAKSLYGRNQIAKRSKASNSNTTKSKHMVIILWRLKHLAKQADSLECRNSKIAQEQAPLVRCHEKR